MVFYMFFMCFNAVGYEGRKKHRIHKKMRRERLLRWRHTKNETNWYEECFFFHSSSFYFVFPSSRKKNCIEPKKEKQKRKKFKGKKESVWKVKNKSIETMERGFLKIKSRKSEQLIELINFCITWCLTFALRGFELCFLV